MICAFMSMGVSQHGFQVEVKSINISSNSIYMISISRLAFVA
jgi:hypothetical protein